MAIGSKLTVLSMRGSYLATKSSLDNLCFVGSRNNSGITVKVAIKFLITVLSFGLIVTCM